MPLASTAVGVVEPARAGMASGINATFRQIGIATGIAALGSIFAAKVRAGGGGIGAAAGPRAAAGVVAGLNEILLIGGIVALVAAVASLALIRQRDFVGDPLPLPAGARLTSS